jgi:GNAT superfamily N-acetyltransferase
MQNPAISPVRSAADLAAVRTLFAAYAASLPISLDYQDFDAELAALPGKYAPPLGALLIARTKAGDPVGCAALRPLQPPAICEMKRLYVAPEGRGLGLGRRLADEIIRTARDAGYRLLRLDTLATMGEAHRLYESLGFTPAAPYYEGAAPGTVFQEKRL